MTRGTRVSPSKQDVRAQLSRLLDHPDFTATPQRRDFLTYVVEETLAGRTEHIKGVSIAMSVFDRDASFDQQIDPVVRLEARRLRHDIDAYYAGAGRSDSLRISIPKGSYVPKFEQDTLASVAESIPLKRPALLTRLRPRGMALIGGGLFIALVLVALYLSQSSHNKRVPVELTIPKGPVIAVLPFVSLGDGPSYVADGITQQLTTELIQFNDLWVLPLGSVARFRDGQTDMNELKSEFKADFALEGIVRDAGENLNISARLIDLATKRYVWAQSYHAASSPEGIYEAQDNIVHDVIGNLAGKYGILAKEAMNAAVRMPPNSRSAYDCVMQYYSYQITIDLERHGEVKGCVEQAVQAEPDYAEAWAVLSNLYMQQIRFALGGDRQEAFQLAEHAARRAIELDPHSATGHLMLANVRFSKGNLSGFQQSGTTAIELNPNDNVILAHFGLRLAFSGSWSEGLAIMDNAIALNPVHPHWYYFPKLFYLYDQGEYYQAIEVLDKIDMPGFFWTHLWRAALNEELGDHDAANVALNKLLILRPDFALEAQNILSIWQLEEEFKGKLMLSLGNAGLRNGGEMQKQ